MGNKGKLKHWRVSQIWQEPENWFTTCQFQHLNLQVLANTLCEKTQAGSRNWLQIWELTGPVALWPLLHYVQQREIHCYYQMSNNQFLFDCQTALLHKIFADLWSLGAPQFWARVPSATTVHYMAQCLHCITTMNRAIGCHSDPKVSNSLTVAKVSKISRVKEVLPINYLALAVIF